MFTALAIICNLSGGIEDCTVLTSEAIFNSEESCEVFRVDAQKRVEDVLTFPYYLANNKCVYIGEIGEPL